MGFLESPLTSQPTVGTKGLSRGKWPVLGLCHSLRPEWKHGIKWLTSGSQDPTAEVIEWVRWYTANGRLTSSNPSLKKRKERHCPLSGWATTDSAPTSVGLKVLAPRTSRKRTVPDPSLLTWEWQDYAILQANPVSNQLSQHHIWWKMCWPTAQTESGCDFRLTLTRRCTHVMHDTKSS